MTMREKMARAIYNSRVSPPVSDGHWAAIKDECMERFEGSAVDAALDALMEPTKEMIVAGECAYSEFEDSGRDTNGGYQFVRPGHEAATFTAMVLAAKECK